MLPRERLLAALGGAALVAALLVAAALRPDASGHGTHQQLGLPPCTFLTLTGHPCPACGMTTAWSNVVHGHWREALRANVGGTVLAVLAMALAPWLLASAFCGRWRLVRPNANVAAVASVVLFAIVITTWIARLCAG